MKPKYSIASFIVILLGWNNIGRHITLQTPTQHDTVCDSANITLLSQNLQAAKYFKKNKRNLDQKKVSEFKDWVSDLSSLDIYCFQEQRYHAKDLLDKCLSHLNKHSVDTIGTSIYTKHKFKEKGFIKIGGNTKYAAWADIIIEDHVLRVYSVHLSSNMISAKAKEVLNETDIANANIWSSLRSMLKRYGKYSKARNGQLDVLFKHIETSPYPVIIAGDFNDVPQSHIYQRMKSNFTDSYQRSDIGISSTYRGSLPGLRIDYIFLDPKISLSKHKVLKQNFSDHYPVQSEFCVK